MKTAIVIPARYNSSRFPGKPLAKIEGETMLERVVKIGREAQLHEPDIDLYVATEDERIESHCNEIGVKCVMTSDTCPTGSDRILEALKKINQKHEFVIGLQGDAPMTQPNTIKRMIEVAQKYQTDVVTPVVKLRWRELDELRKNKFTTPFSGTTAVINENGDALWFSKNIIPAIRDEAQMRATKEFSPVHQHLGLYGYRVEVLEYFVSLPQSQYEKLEGLEQLRLLENGVEIKTVVIETEAGAAQSGVDTPEDAVRIGDLLSKKNLEKK